jgi:hypothetical protein
MANSPALITSFYTVANGVATTPIFVGSYIISDWVINTFKFEKEYQWPFISILSIGTSLLVKDFFTPNFIWFSVPVSILAYFMASQTSKKPFITFMAFFGYSLLLYFMVGFIHGKIYPPKNII